MKKLYLSLSHILPCICCGQMLVGVKKKNDYLDWCSVARLMSNKAHLTQEGLNLIRTIKSGMNTGRK